MRRIDHPIVPGHEIVGVAEEERLEIHCSKGAVFTFNGVDVDGSITKGGYSTFIVVHHRIPENYPLESAAPLLCAGITVYRTMIHHKMNQLGKSLEVIGLGGLGHMAVKFGKAFGLNIIVLSTSINKKEGAFSLLGADKFVVSSDKEEMKALAKSLDFIIDTASGNLPFDPYMEFLKTSDVLVLVGYLGELKLESFHLLRGMKTATGSASGGTKIIQEMLDFCVAYKIYPEIEKILIQYVNEALDRFVKRDVKYRFVIDIENSL
ncbi:Alcohol dehydrogenase-like, C-terminal [Dillenia turbinata]|uniref:Alcohol dehydrogenase-like, C-terminal n=1 Tax=Dillenia turbinata TaxID=194707 RepID=A0AAN8UVB9_9MAGN